jgi:penicillin amidase
LTEDPGAGYRAERIHQLLGDRDDLRLDDLQAIQLDAHNANGEQLVPTLLDVDPALAGDDADAVATIQGQLADWNLQDAVDVPGSAAFNATWRHLLARTFHDEVGTDDDRSWAWPSGGSRWWEVARELATRAEDPWWDDITTEPIETRDDTLAAAMVDAHTELVELLGDDPETWAWGELHQLALTHSTFGTSGIAPIEALFNRGPVRVPGGTAVVNANGWSAPDGYAVNWVPSMRLLVDIGDRDAGGWVHLTGQSGHPFHPHYTDQVESWRDGGLLPIAFTADGVDDATVDRLILRP